MPRSLESESDGVAAALAMHLCLYCAVAGLFAAVLCSNRAREGLRNMHHFYPRGAFYLACMTAGGVLILLFYFWSEQIWALWVWLWT
jgi:hypothetical protein